MYIKLLDDNRYIYPYSPYQLINDYPNISFPTEIGESLLAEYNIFPVQVDEMPIVDYTKNVIADEPILTDGKWHQSWKVESKPDDEVIAIANQLRAEAYRNESDPLFFKWQRAEVTEQEWLDKVAEIKLRFPKP